MKRRLLDRLRWMVRLMARGTAIFLGLFTVLNIAGDRVSRGFDSNIWWVDVRMLPPLVGSLVLLAGACGLVAVGFGWAARGWKRWAQAATVMLLGVVIVNVMQFYGLLVRGGIGAGVVVPLSLLLAAVLGMILWATWRDGGRLTAWQRGVVLATLVGCGVVFPLAQMYCFGKTDYRRRADAIVVFGAAVYPDGTPSQALADRVNTAIDLYHEGLAPVLIFSGGPGMGRTTEAQAMRNVGLSRGVPAEAMLLDDEGMNTELTAGNTVRMFRAQFHTVLAVSHFYHLPRVKMTYERALYGEKGPGSVEVLTVPAKESAPLVRMPFYMGREVAGLWVYYLRPLVGG